MPARCCSGRRALAFALALHVFAHPAQAQGCMASRFMSQGPLGPEGLTYLQPGQWQVGASFRYLYADEGYRGSHPWPEYATLVGNRISVSALDLMAAYSFTPRTSLTVTVPYIVANNSNPAEHDGTRHSVNSSGIGDI